MNTATSRPAASADRIGGSTNLMKGTALVCSLFLHAGALALLATYQPSRGGLGQHASSEPTMAFALVEPEDPKAEPPAEISTPVAEPAAPDVETPSVEAPVERLEPPSPIAAPFVASPASSPSSSNPAKRSAARKSGSLRGSGESGGAGDAGMKPGGVYEAAQYLSTPAAAYPARAGREHREGVVILTVMVDAKGVPGAINIARSSGAADLDQAAIEAVRRWRFHPARQGGVAVASRVQVPVRFQLSRHDS